MQILSALLFLTCLLPLALANSVGTGPANAPPEAEPGVDPPITAPYDPHTSANIRTFTYDACRMQDNSKRFLALPQNKCWDATPNPVFNIARGFGSFKADYNGQIVPGTQCAVTVYDNKECDGKVNGTSHRFVIGKENQEECFNVEMGEGVKGFAVEWTCNALPE